MSIEKSLAEIPVSTPRKITHFAELALGVHVCGACALSEGMITFLIDAKHRSCIDQYVVVEVRSADAGHNIKPKDKTVPSELRP